MFIFIKCINLFLGQIHDLGMIKHSHFYNPLLQVSKFAYLYLCNCYIVLTNLNPQEMPNYVMNRNYPYDKGMNFEGKYYQGNYMVSQPNILDGNVNNPNNSYMANNVNNNYFNPPNPNHYNNNMQQKNMIPQPGFAHTNKFQNNMNSNNYSYPKNNIMNVNAKNNNTLNFGNPNNNNMYLNNQKNQEQFHIQKFNKQIHFNKSFVNSDKSPIKPQNTHTTQPIISNVWINQNANNMTNNSDKNNITNSQINDQLPNTQNTNLQDETKLNHINDGTTNVAIGTFLIKKNMHIS
ncbi:clustered-asparagine-rich protein [Plasmodium yoelii yoelii]|uniref:Clustered-asparagine-rich protein n=1 Tax=Plasmodium yoelii yoelii TaxID=73239 RepID=Q7RIW8_PLAYO|nr:clustered-asparagine-rich protein [Plasmodium yoelii yoelii]